jgi:CRP/FNR family transcriptional regulator, cyclic AMP receptor protein
MTGGKHARRKDRGQPGARTSALVGLQKVDLFQGLDAATLGEIAAQCKWTRCKRNQYVVRRDAADRDVYFVIAGTVRMAAQAGRGRRVVFRDVAAGDMFGEQSVVDGQACFADVLGLRESLLASLPLERLRDIAAQHAPVRERLLRRLAASQRELAERMLELHLQPVQRRIRAEMARLARLSGVADNRARLDPAPPHGDIADRVGTSREQVTRELSRLARAGSLERDGHALVVRDVRALEA